MADHILLIRMIPTMNIIITEKANLLLTIEDKAFFKPKESVSARRKETHKRHMEESQREQKRLMETLTQLKESTQIQMDTMQERRNQEAQQKERQLQMELANSVFSRGTNQQKSERQQEEKQEKIKRGELDVQTSLSEQETVDLYKKHPPLPPSQFLEMAKQFREEQEHLIKSQEVKLQINEPSPISTTTPTPTPTQIKVPVPISSTRLEPINLNKIVTTRTPTSDISNNNPPAPRAATSQSPKFSALKDTWERRSSVTEQPKQPEQPEVDASNNEISQDASGNNVE